VLINQNIVGRGIVAKARVFGSPNMSGSGVGKSGHRQRNAEQPCVGLSRYDAHHIVPKLGHSNMGQNAKLDLPVGPNTSSPD